MLRISEKLVINQIRFDKKFKKSEECKVIYDWSKKKEYL